MMSLGLILGVAGIVGAAMFGQAVLLWVYRPIYAAHAHTLMLIMLCATITYVAGFLGVGMTAVRSFRAQLPVLTVSTLTTFAACRWLVPTMGMNGAAIAMSLGVVMQAIGSLLIIFLAISNSANWEWRAVAGRYLKRQRFSNV
jgi:O-antigen/teichoic acid export membrane protein